jgi:hypothetical protein
MGETLKQIELFERKCLKDLLHQCTEKQQAFFLRLYPEGPDLMAREKISRAIEQCEATIKKNETKSKGEKENG